MIRRNYNATVAKIMAMYGKRITGRDYKELAKCPSVQEAADYLKKNTRYSKLLAPIDANTIHRGALENMLRRSVFETYIKITGFERIREQEFYNYKLIQSEVSEILNCIRHINAKSEGQISDVPIYMKEYIAFDLIELSRVRTFEGLLEVLRRTPYREILSGVEISADGKADYMECEKRLRAYYINRLKESLRFSPDVSKSIEFLLFTDIDLINVINSYRLTAFFGQDSDEIEKNMLPFSGRLSKARQREVYSAPDSAEFIGRFSKTYYGRQMEEYGFDVNELEISAQRLRHKYAKQALKRSASAPLSVYSFIFLLEIEVQNLISVIEAIRYGLHQKQIRSLIIA